MNKKLGKRWIKSVAIILALIWMAIIFCMSAQPADVSGDLSGSVSYLFVQVINAVFGCGWNEIELLQLAELWDYPIRKLAHMTEFGILALLYLWVLWNYRNKVTELCNRMNCRFVKERPHAGVSARKLGLLALIGATIYAATDEFHQLFVPGRAGLVTDVLIDATGAAIALVLCGVAVAVVKKRKAVKNTRHIDYK